MSNAGVLFIAGLMAVVGLLAGYINSYLIMQTINATSTMWSLWWGSMILVVLGALLAKAAE